MSKAELMEVRWLGAGFILSLLSVFFGVVSAYIAGLYFVLSKATLALRLLAFFVLGSGFGERNASQGCRRTQKCKLSRRSTFLSSRTTLES